MVPLTTSRLLGAARPAKCAIDGCDGARAGRGWCVKHYKRWTRHGDPLVGTKPAPDRLYGPPEVRFWALVDKTAPGGCWLWTANLDPHGYGRCTATLREDGTRRSGLAHRWAYEDTHGPIPDELPLDHVCHSNDKACPGGDTCPHRRCVNPAHLEPVPIRVNLLRGRTFQAANAAKTHCLHGHPFDEANTYRTPRGERQCRACSRASKRCAMERRRARWQAGTVPADARTHCIRGHELTPENTRINDLGRQICRTCVREQDARRRGQHRPALPRGSQIYCKRGHLFDEANTYVNAGRRTCRACARVRHRDRQRKAAA